VSSTRGTPASGRSPVTGDTRAVTVGAYLALFLLGLVQTVIGTFQYGRGPAPMAAILFDLAILATCLLGSWGMRSALGGVLPAAGCLLGAMGMHLLFDAPYVALAVKVAVNLVSAGTLYLALRRGYASRAQKLLTGLETAGAITPAEAAAVISRRRRRRLAQRATPGAERDLLLTRQRELLALVDAAAP